MLSGMLSGMTPTSLGGGWNLGVVDRDVSKCENRGRDYGSCR